MERNILHFILIRDNIWGTGYEVRWEDIAEFEKPLYSEVDGWKERILSLDKFYTFVIQ